METDLFSRILRANDLSVRALRPVPWMRAGGSVGRRFGSEEDFGVANAVFLCVPVCAVLLRLSLFLCCGGIRGGTAPPRPRDDGERVAGRDNGQAAREPFLA